MRPMRRPYALPRQHVLTLADPMQARQGLGSVLLSMLERAGALGDRHREFVVR
jgi:hypothetical protein